MIRINSFLHRDRLRYLIERWMRDELRDDDVDDILQQVHFNNVFVSYCLERLAAEVFGGLYGHQLHTERVTTKGALRDRISHEPPVDCGRCAELIAAYRHAPGRYFRETPFHGTLYFQAGQGGALRYVGSSRIKRIRRLAEKAARRVVDWLYEVAGEEDRPESVPDDLARTEQGLLAVFQERHAVPDPDRLAINDVAGIKVILEADELDRLLSLLTTQDCVLVEQERHTGDYSATNLIVEFRPDRAAILAKPLHERMLRVFAAHGYDAGQAGAAFRDFVLSGEDSIRLEIIVTSYREMLESEIGRCMHEERIIRQRHAPRYQGQLAQNTGFLMEFLFTFPALPRRRLERLPVRIGNRYLPDTFDEIRRRLFDNPSVELNEL